MRMTGQRRDFTGQLTLSGTAQNENARATLFSQVPRHFREISGRPVFRGRQKQRRD